MAMSMANENKYYSMKRRFNKQYSACVVMKYNENMYVEKRYQYQCWLMKKPSAAAGDSLPILVTTVASATLNASLQADSNHSEEVIQSYYIPHESLISLLANDSIITALVNV